MASTSTCMFVLLALIPLSVATFDCYDTLCIGTDEAKTTVPCDQSKGVCEILPDGTPKCDPSPTGGKGINCTDEFHYCSANETGSAVCVYTPWTCYNTKCQGAGDQSTTFIPCDQSNGTCSVDATGVPVCTEGSIGLGVNCTTDETRDEFYCQNDLTSGVAQCVYPPKHDCYDSTCTGTGDFSTTVITCDQNKNRCSVNETGYPLCINTTRGEGVDCSKDDEFYCSVDKNGAALCVVPANHTCYDMKCVGKSATLECNQTDHRCVIDADGEATCVNTTRGNGVDCSGVEHTDFYCSNDQDTGAAICQITPAHTCYNNKCVGTGEFNATFVECDQSVKLCQVNETGYPLCEELSRGAGVNCTTDDVHDEYYCQNNVTTGVAECVYPPKHTCYDTKCVGKSATKDCNQKDHRCVIDADGEATCVNTTRGNGVDCAGVEHTDFYCSNNEETGAAICQITPAHTCYNNKCVGTGEFNATFVECDQSVKLCQVNETGYPLCEELSRGAGVNCTKDDVHDEYYCQNNVTTGVAECVYPPKHDCYDTTCTGTELFNTTVITCDQNKNRCGVNETGYPLCINTTRGAGVDCEHTSPLDFYCSYPEGGAAQCVFTPPLSCYNQFCQGTGSKNTSWLNCDGAGSRCTVESDGSPVCVPGSRGSGVNCNGTNYYCSHAAGDPFTALCMYPQNYSCYNTKCHGEFNYSQTYIGCSQDDSYCSLDKEGSPLCVSDNSTSGEGILCTGHFSCKSDEVGVATCEKSSGLLPLWIVLGVVLAVVIVIIIVWVMKRRSTAEDRQSLITPAF